MYSRPMFLQGVYPFAGSGLSSPAPLSRELSYTVPDGKRAQFIYFRAGNSTGELIYVMLTRDGKPMRIFPIGAKGDVHVALAVVEDLVSGTDLGVQVAAPKGLMGEVVLDIGFTEI